MDSSFTQKKIALFVIIAHLCCAILLYFIDDLEFPTQKEALKVTIIDSLPSKVVISASDKSFSAPPKKITPATQKSSAKAEKAAPQKTSSLKLPSQPKKEAPPKKNFVKDKIAQKSPNPSKLPTPQTELLQQLSGALASLKTDKRMEARQELKVPGKVSLSSANGPFFKKETSTTLTERSLDLESESGDTLFLSLRSLVVALLKESLKLPEYGEVKVKFTINPNGDVADLKILNYKSLENRDYLLQELPQLTFPFFSQEKQARTLIVTFKNED